MLFSFGIMLAELEIFIPLEMMRSIVHTRICIGRKFFSNEGSTCIFLARIAATILIF